MRKSAIALAGVILLAGQAAAAAASGAAPVVGDRVGARVGVGASKFQGRTIFDNPLLLSGIIITAIAVPIAIARNDDDKDITVSP